MISSLQRWLDRIEVSDRRTAKLICKLIPARCPFARDISLMGFWQIHIPPLCKLNPFYEQLLELRFRATCFLSEDSED